MRPWGLWRAPGLGVLSWLGDAGGDWRCQRWPGGDKGYQEMPEWQVLLGVAR